MSFWQFWINKAKQLTKKDVQDLIDENLKDENDRLHQLEITQQNQTNKINENAGNIIIINDEIEALKQKPAPDLSLYAKLDDPSQTIVLDVIASEGNITKYSPTDNTFYTDIPKVNEGLTPSQPNDLTTKSYVDEKFSSIQPSPSGEIDIPVIELSGKIDTYEQINAHSVYLNKKINGKKVYGFNIKISNPFVFGYGMFLISLRDVPSELTFNITSTNFTIFNPLIEQTLTNGEISIPSTINVNNKNEDIISFIPMWECDGNDINLFINFQQIKTTDIISNWQPDQTIIKGSIEFTKD